jgi:predicted metalloprotease
MNSMIRPKLFAVAALLLLAGGATLYLASARADSGHGAQNLVLKSQSSANDTMEQFLTDVTKDVDAYWTNQFKAAGLDEPRVNYAWIPAGQTAQSVCGGDGGTLGDDAAAYCAGDDTIYISEQFAAGVFDGSLDQSLPGSAQGFGEVRGDMAVAYMVAHEYGHEVQNELGLDQKYAGQLPTMSFELQADCFAGNWAKSAADDNRLEQGDVQEALNAAMAVGDFDADNPGHHGTPEQREEAWTRGFQSGDPTACNTYLSA